MHKREGLRSHPGVISPGWGLSTLSLLWNSSIRSQCRRHLGILSWRVASGSPGYACAISSRGTSLTPRPGSMATAGANPGRKLRCMARMLVSAGGKHGSRRDVSRGAQASRRQRRLRRASWGDCLLTEGERCAGLDLGRAPACSIVVGAR